LTWLWHKQTHTHKQHHLSVQPTPSTGRGRANGTRRYDATPAMHILVAYVDCDCGCDCGSANVHLSTSEHILQMHRLLLLLPPHRCDPVSPIPHIPYSCTVALIPLPPKRQLIPALLLSVSALRAYRRRYPMDAAAFLLCSWRMKNHSAPRRGGQIDPALLT
jgi:hypothetical protein